MPSIRIGFASDFTLNNSLVGFGTTTADQKLEVAGTLKGDFQITGVTTLTEYSGFVAQQQHINEPSTIGFSTSGIGSFQQYYETETGYIDLGGVHHGDDQYYNTLSEDLVIGDGQILNITNTDMVGSTTIGEYDPHNHSSYVCAGSLEQVSVTDHFSVPNGGSNDRQETPIEGTVRFNDDLNTLEFFNGNEWRQFTYNQGQSGRMLTAGGYGSSSLTLIEYVNISTTGNAVHFGELDAAQYDNGGCANSIRGLSAGNSPYADVIEYVTMASGGKGIDFGNLIQGRRLSHSGMANSNRGVFAGGKIPASPNFTNIIDTVNIMTIGNAVDFGDMSLHRDSSAFVFASPIRGLFGGGKNTDGVDFSSVELINISSGGDSSQFPEIITAREQGAGSCNQTKGVFAGGQSGPTIVNNIESIIISSLGNSVEFGNLTVSVRQLMSAGSHTRGVFAGGKTPSSVNAISYVNISSSGDALDFGDLTVAKHAGTAFSDCHGGLGGF